MRLADDRESRRPTVPAPYRSETVKPPVKGPKSPPPPGMADSRRKHDIVEVPPPATKKDPRRE
jgi:hypothetical protein